MTESGTRRCSNCIDLEDLLCSRQCSPPELGLMPYPHHLDDFEAESPPSILSVISGSVQHRNHTGERTGDALSKKNKFGGGPRG